MNTPWQVRVYENQQPVYTTEITGPFELGRQADRNERAFAQKTEGGITRLIVARLEEQSVSRRHVRLEPLGPQRLRLTNLSTRQALRFHDGRELQPQQV